METKNINGSIPKKENHLWNGLVVAGIGNYLLLVFISGIIFGIFTYKGTCVTSFWSGTEHACSFIEYTMEGIYTTGVYGSIVFVPILTIIGYITSKYISNTTKWYLTNLASMIILVLFIYGCFYLFQYIFP